ncbi:MAG: transporter substrate-binding domain-containing protein [Bacteroidetes bacterium]|nr:transporter substrate-binding domain-containing protein [Bacteroidota bacterium]
MNVKSAFGVIVFLLLPVTSHLCAQSGDNHQRKLLIGTKVAPPFAMKDSSGVWRGLSIELWQRIAADMKMEYEFREYDLQGLLRAVRDSTVDAGVAALSITAEREALMDFTHPYYNSGLGIAVVPTRKAEWLGVLEQLLSLKLLLIIALLAIGTVVVGALMWLVERGRNPSQFGGTGLRGLGSGMWWSAVTMTTVGYGDKAPVTLIGRLLALCWMIAAIIIISVFTATITAKLTVSQLESSIRGPEDLANVNVGTVIGSTSERYLQAHHVRYRTFKTPVEGLSSVASGTIDAMVYDAPMLQYLCSHQMRDAVHVLPNVFERQYYGIALPARSPLRKEINKALLNETHQTVWGDLLFEYLGE